MEILGVGPSELLFIIIIALIVLGPKEMQKTGRTVGRWLNQLMRSDGWKAVQQTTAELRKMPTQWMREANMELAETERELRKATDLKNPPASKTTPRVPRPDQPENSILPPSASRAIPTTSETEEPKPNQDE